MYKKLLSFRKSEAETGKVVIHITWDFNDCSYMERTLKFDAESFFNDARLIISLAYASRPYDFKGHDWNDRAFRHYIPDNKDVKLVFKILDDLDLVPDIEYEPCHSVVEVEISYYDNEGEKFEVTFDPIVKRWENMTYLQICEEVNSVTEGYDYDDDEFEDDDVNDEYGLHQLRSPLLWRSFCILIVPHFNFYVSLIGT